MPMGFPSMTRVQIGKVTFLAAVNTFGHLVHISLSCSVVGNVVGTINAKPVLV
jgi:hypothetical protein